MENSSIKPRQYISDFWDLLLKPITFFLQLNDCLASLVDRFLRNMDLEFNRTHGGRIHNTLGLSRHTFHYLLWPAMIAAMMTMGVFEWGPRLLLAIATFGLFAALLTFAGRLADRYKLNLKMEMVLQVALVLAVGGLHWLPGESTYVKGTLIYEHFFILAAFVVGAALLLYCVLMGIVWSKWDIATNYNEAITRTELFDSWVYPPPLQFKRLLLAAAMVPLRAPLQLLLLPAAILLVCVPPNPSKWWGICLIVGSWMFLTLGGINTSLDKMWRLFGKAFLRGETLIVSLIIIALAVARWLDVSYVTTIFDTAEGWVIALLLFNTYVLLWWYDYWVKRLIAQKLLQLIDPQATCTARIDYPIHTDASLPSVPAEGRSLQIHGASRFIVLGPAPSGQRPPFQAYGFEGLFQSLADRGFYSKDASQCVRGHSPNPRVASPNSRQIQARVQSFNRLARAILIGLTCLCFWWIVSGEQEPQLTAKTTGIPNLTLTKLLDNHAERRGDRPALILAASGGGTRAALYTAAVLEGLAKRDRLQDVVMSSGVSGGGAALAYFAGHRTPLVHSVDGAWNTFFKRLSKSYIQDVINAAIEWRTVSGSRLGKLLSNSFENWWELDEDCDQMGEISKIGLILNTSIAGRFACNSTEENCLQQPLKKAEAVKAYRKQMTHSDVAAGRLILTNLLLDPAFVPPVTEVGGAEGLPVIVDDPDTRLETAAALNANFPPVFSNAAVDIDGKARYWVTDGGTVDNRGIEMPLYALRESLKCYNEGNLRAHQELPVVTVVAIDASAYNTKYTQDRGIGTLIGAGAQYASQLMVELQASIQEIYDRRGQGHRFRFVYLPMPLCLRKSGSFGTHWMLQPNIQVKRGEKEPCDLTGEEMIDLLRALHTPWLWDNLSKHIKEILEQSKKDPKWSDGAEKLGFM